MKAAAFNRLDTSVTELFELVVVHNFSCSTCHANFSGADESISMTLVGITPPTATTIADKEAGMKALASKGNIGINAESAEMLDACLAQVMTCFVPIPTKPAKHASGYGSINNKLLTT